MNLHPLMLMGFLICNLGFWPLFITLARRGGLHSSISSMQKSAEAFRSPQAGWEMISLWGGGVLIALGCGLMFLGVFLMDSSQNSFCKNSCKEEGFESGIVRGSPHAERPGETERQCWCFNGRGKDATWRKEGISIPEK